MFIRLSIGLKPCKDLASYSIWDMTHIGVSAWSPPVRVTFCCLQSRYEVTSSDALFGRTFEQPWLKDIVQCVPIKKKPVSSVGYLHCNARFNQTICFIIKGIFSSFIWYQTHDDILMHKWKGTIKLMHVKIDLRRIMVLSWYDQVRTTNPCQNKESKQKKHDKRDKRNANECLFNTYFYFERVRPCEAFKFLFCANQFWHHHLKSFVLGHAWPIHLVTGVKTKKINWIL